MVQTRSARKNIDSGQLHASNRPHKEDPAVGLAPDDGAPSDPAKRPQRTDAPSLKKRRRGKPGELCQLNLDVLFLIAAYIHPIDLLNLARTCRSLRELLMDKSSVFVWKTTFRQVKGLPACPVDLTEPEYANLVFYARCHGCGKYTTTILWNVRRRYCPGCRIRRLRTLSSCNEIIRKNNVLAIEYIKIKKVTSMRVDRDKATLFMHEYHQSSDKRQFVIDEQKHCTIILQHARKCEAWQKVRDLERKRDNKELRRERSQRIFRRLEEHGYSREIRHFGYTRIEGTRESDFRTSKPLTDREWDKICPEWIKIMNDFRSRRLEDDVYLPRRRALVSAYNTFVVHPSPDAPTLDLLPHVSDLARFRPFMDIIKAPEETRVNDKSFAPAFLQLPGLAAEWKKKLDAELAELVKIPLRLSSSNPSKSRALAPGGSCAEAFNANLDRLHLASALLRTAKAGVFTHIEVSSVSMLDCRCGCGYVYGSGDDSERTGSVSHQFGIQFLEEAPYIVHACGLNPNVATADDMDHRNARLKCLWCEGSALVMNWRHAMWHAYSYHQSSPALASLCKSLRWQLVSDEHLSAIQTIEETIEGNPLPTSLRCLLCRPYVGDVIRDMRAFEGHLYSRHALGKRDDNIKPGVHYAPIGIFNSQSAAVEIVREGDQVRFTVPSKDDSRHKT